MCGAKNNIENGMILYENYEYTYAIIIFDNNIHLTKKRYEFLKNQSRYWRI